MNGYGLSRERFGLLFAVMLVAAAGNTAMQSLMPAIGRELRIPDFWVAFAFSLSAVLWVLAAPHWARMADRRGRRALMRLGLYGFIISMLICGAILAAGLAGLVSATIVFIVLALGRAVYGIFGSASPPAVQAYIAARTDGDRIGSLLAAGLAGLVSATIVFIVLALGRAVYGIFGSASPPAVQAYIAARTDGEQRTNAIAAIASSFGLGTIIGPAVAPLFIFPPLALSGPLFVFAGVGAAVLAALVLRLPDDTPRNPARGAIVDYPSIGGPGAAPAAEGRAERRLRWRDPRVFVWHVIGTIGGHGHAALFTVVGFLVIDRLQLPLDEAQQWIALVLIAGAMATLLAQWWLIPQLRLEPRGLVLWGSIVAGGGSVLAGLTHEIYGITMGFALASLGFGMFRPGFTSGASLAVAVDEQNAVAGMVTSVNGIAYIAGPAIGVGLYGLWMPLPFLATAALMMALALWVSLRFRPLAPAA